MTTTYKFDNGLRMVHVATDSPVEYCGVAVRAGSRDERSDEYGLAHFVEHTIFKGTVKRPANRIINHMETVGGELNAYTTKEETYIYAVSPAGYLRRAVDLIADLVINSQFPDSELDKEREVVAEEIDSYLDTPSEAVYDDFEDLMFVGKSLGHNILGTRESLRTFDSARCRSFIERFYSAPNMVFFYLGREPAAKVQSLVGHMFEGLPTHSVEHNYDCYNLGEVEPFTVRRSDEDNHQAHTVMGCLVPSFYDDERYAISLINNILGGPGMNSRLNVQLRERRGLVYSVESSIAYFSDCGLLTVYAGCNPEDNKRCMKLITKELERISSTELTQRALDAARKQFLGQQIVASASKEQTVLSAARTLLFHDRVITRADVERALGALTPASLLASASRLSPARFSALTLG